MKTNCKMSESEKERIGETEKVRVTSGTWKNGGKFLEQ